MESEPESLDERRTTFTVVSTPRPLRYSLTEDEPEHDYFIPYEILDSIRSHIVDSGTLITLLNFDIATYRTAAQSGGVYGWDDNMTSTYVLLVSAFPAVNDDALRARLFSSLGHLPTVQQFRRFLRFARRNGRFVVSVDWHRTLTTPLIGSNPLDGAFFVNSAPCIKIVRHLDEHSGVIVVDAIDVVDVRESLVAETIGVSYHLEEGDTHLRNVDEYDGVFRDATHVGRDVCVKTNLFTAVIYCDHIDSSDSTTLALKWSPLVYRLC